MARQALDKIEKIQTLLSLDSHIKSNKTGKISRHWQGVVLMLFSLSPFERNLVSLNKPKKFPRSKLSKPRRVWNQCQRVSRGLSESDSAPSLPSCSLHSRPPASPGQAPSPPAQQSPAPPPAPPTLPPRSQRSSPSHLHFPGTSHIQGLQTLGRRGLPRFWSVRTGSLWAPPN